MTTFHADEDALEALSDDVGGLWSRSTIPVLDAPPEALAFLRDFVRPSVPCIIRHAIPSHDDGGVGGGAAASQHLTLTLDEIVARVGEDAELTVDITPDGHGDCIRSISLEDDDAAVDEDPKRSRRGKKMFVKKMFVKPHEERMGIGRFRNLLRRGSRRGCGGTNGNGHRRINCDAGELASDVDTNGLEVYPLHRDGSKCSTKKDAAEILDAMERPPVVYYSRQNDCLRTEVAKLFATKLFPESFPFAEEAFGTGPPDAVNLWMGNERSVSSMHKDHYENLFYVCSGQKEFVLCPPADVVFLHEDEFCSGTFRPMQSMEAVGGARGDTGRTSWTVVADGGGDDGEDNEKTKWIEPDVAKHMSNSAYSSQFPLLPKAHPTKVLVSEGEMLYIPSLWYHRVTQTCETVGVNYWYDMKFDGPQWCYFNFVQNLKATKSATACEEKINEPSLAKYCESAKSQTRAWSEEDLK